jgi:simple sugar transport system permease protein
MAAPTRASSEQAAPAGAAPPTRSGLARAADAFFARREASILVVTVALAVYFYFNAVDFVSSDNARTLATFIAAPAIIAAGEVMLMICGEIDLSVGQVYAFAPFIVVKLHDGGVPLLLCVLLSMIACTGIGLINGVVTTVIGVSSFVTTLGMFFLLNGVTLTIAHGRPVDTPGSGTYANIFGGGAYSEFIWAVCIAIAIQILLMRTRWGLHTIATGGNRLGASEAGVKVRVVAIRNFMLSSALAGFTGVLESVRITSTDPSAGGAEIMFLAISAAVIGGTLLAGGSGTVIGAFIGAAFLGILHDGFTIQGVSAFTFDLILGIAILVAMIVNVYVGRIRRGSIGG